MEFGFIYSGPLRSGQLANCVWGQTCIDVQEVQSGTFKAPDLPGQF